MPTEQPKKSSHESPPFFSSANLELGFWKATMVLPTQPLQVIMRAQQAALASKTNPRALTAFQAFAEIAKQNSGNATVAKRSWRSILQPFFKGGAIGAAKEGLKNTTYKAPLITGAPNLADKILAPTQAKKKLSPLQYHVLNSFVSGGVAASVDVGLGGALEAWATFLSTAQGKDAKASFVQEVKEAPRLTAKLQLLYRGFIPATVKSSVAFTTFFISAEPIKTGVRQLYGLKEHERMSWGAMLLSAFASGTLVALTSSPADIAKTQSQMPNSKGRKLIPALKANYKTYGLVGMTAGMPLKCLLIITGWGLNFVITQREKPSEQGMFKQQKPVDKPKNDSSPTQRRGFFPGS